MSGSWMLRQLDYVTRPHHVPADAGRLALFNKGVTPERYVDFLSRLYSFEAPIEARWKRMPELATVLDVERRIRTPFLLADLHALGAQPELLPVPNFIGIEQALGWMYVVERGRRLNGMLYRHLQRRLPREAMLGGNYLVASTSSGARWEELGRTLDKVANNAVKTDQIVNAANRAFRALRMTPIASSAAPAAPAPRSAA
ncbi:MAG TPA: biliverdin-producing heme oxygenase [Kofleriaceae bacterium]|nr:biliverdin-producing heme oxygenase [Kofleriaceae bacterium]